VPAAQCARRRCAGPRAAWGLGRARSRGCSDSDRARTQLGCVHIIEADGAPRARGAALRAGPARTATASRVVERRQRELARGATSEKGPGVAQKDASFRRRREQAPLHHSAGHSAVSWRVAAVPSTLRGLRVASGAQQPSTWGWIRRGVRSCGASARSSSPQLAFVRARTGAPLSQPQCCQPHGGGGSGHDQGSV
jgi:hypothetical protein